MQKRSIINNIYKHLDKTRVTSHIYTDNDWSGKDRVVNDIENAIDKINIKHNTEYALSFSDSHYEGVIGELGHCKKYEYNIIDADSNEIVNIEITCAFCGKISDPMGAYDCTVIMW